jgi:hypothetical protein
MPKWLINTSERRVENGEVIITQGTHTVVAENASLARLAFKPFPNEKIESIVKEEEPKKKKNK